MTEFFYNHECGITHDNHTVLKHHFTFGTYYAPTKFGRSTLRRVDYITLDTVYSYKAERNYILLLYPLSTEALSVTLNDISYDLQPCQLARFVIPKGTLIALTTNTTHDILLFECDILTAPEKIIALDTPETTYETNITILNINDNHTINLENKPFFGFILDGDCLINTNQLNAYDGFYTDKTIDIVGNGKILTFSMPIPL